MFLYFINVTKSMQLNVVMNKIISIKTYKFLAFLSTFKT